MTPCLSCGCVTTVSLCGRCEGMVPQAMVLLARSRGARALLELAWHIAALRREVATHG